MGYKIEKISKGLTIIRCYQCNFGLIWSSSCSKCGCKIEPNIVRLRDFMNQMDGKWDFVMRGKRGEL